MERVQKNQARYDQLLSQRKASDLATKEGRYVWARSKCLRDGTPLVGKLILDWESKKIGWLLAYNLDGSPVGPADQGTYYAPDAMETPTPLTKKELFKYKLAGKI